MGCIAVGGTSATRQCCGYFCQPESPEYDPETEQCCGEGTALFATVYSNEVGCCPGGYSGYPQSFDQGNEQCCGVNANDMPLVCSLHVVCPPQGQWRECPATDGAATLASYSSTAEAGEQLLPAAVTTSASNSTSAPRPALSLRGAAAVNTRRQCCGSYCQPDSPEYDPETEQCCGEGRVFATVFSREVGCCPGGYSGYPQSFDLGSEQCCGVDANDMPLVCNMGVACPPQGQWRECLAPDGNATFANYSSAEAGEQLLP